MKAKQRTLVVLLILVILAGGALALLTCSNQKAEQAASEAEEGSIQLSSFAVDDLTRIQYTYQGETVSLLYDGDTWTLEDDPEYHLDQNKCDTMATALADLRAKRQLEAQGDHLAGGRNALEVEHAAGPGLLFHHGSPPHKKFLLLKLFYFYLMILPDLSNCKRFFPGCFQF